MIWHSSDVADVLNELAVDETKGLANGVAEMRLKQYGRNTLSNVEKPSFIKRLLSQLNNKLFYLITVFCLLSLGVSLIYEENGKWLSPLLIIAIVILNAVVSTISIHKSDTALDSMKSITNPTATVLREGIVKEIFSDELVPGDIVLLKEGDYITADVRLIETNVFRCNELNISGITVPSDKKADTVVEDITPISDRINMAYSGCSVAHGTAKAVVVETGINSELGHASSIIQQTGEDTLPMQATLDNTSKLVNTAILVCCVIAFIIGMIKNFNTTQSFAVVTVDVILNSIALGVAAIPECLPAISTIVIALGIRRIIKDDIIIKNPLSLEALGNTTVICADKTGILTRNHMTVSVVYDGAELTEVESGNISERCGAVLRLAATCSTLENDPTENAIKSACIKYNSISESDVENVFPRLALIPFDSDRKTMTSINMLNGKPVAIVKGAPEIVAEKCTNIDAEKILSLNENMASESLRVVCIAIKQLSEVPANPNPDEIETGLTFVGLIGLSDPPRNDAIEGIKICDKAGIKTIMITGDNVVTAMSIARRIGILKDGTQAITGAELTEMSDEEFKNNIKKYSVYARVSPEDKLRIIKAWQDKGEIVAITGDSINDANALAAADIGCTLGKRGADVAKGNADIIISNSNFISIVRAIRESRGLFENIKKSIVYLLSCNFGELLAYIAGSLIFGLSPLSAIHLLWINLLTDCAPAMALSTETSENDVMERRMGRYRGLFSLNSLTSIFAHSLFISVITLIAFALGLNSGDGISTTMAFTTLGLSQVFHAYNMRSKKSIFLTNLNNKTLNLSAIGLAFGILFLALTPVGFMFGLKILTAGQLLISLLLSLTVLAFGETYKITAKLINGKSAK